MFFITTFLNFFFNSFLFRFFFFNLPLFGISKEIIFFKNVSLFTLVRFFFSFLFFYYDRQSVFIINFFYYKFFFIVGLWFKRRINKSGDILYLYIGNRHWLIFSILDKVKILPARKRSVVLFSTDKINLTKTINVLKNFKIEFPYKIMGIFNIRVFRRWLNVRYIRIHYLTIKKSSKQQFI